VECGERLFDELGWDESDHYPETDVIVKDISTALTIELVIYDNLALSAQVVLGS